MALSEAPRKLTESLLQRLYRISLTETSHYQIENLRQLLQQNPANLVLYFNHIAPDDPALIFSLYRGKIDPKNKRKVLLPASIYHSDFLKEPLFAAFIHLGRLLLGYEIVEVVQTDDEGKPRYGYTKVQAFKTYKNLIRAVRNLSRGTFIIAPEGTRSHDGTLQKGKDGIVAISSLFLKNGIPTILVPIGITYLTRVNPDSINVGASVSLNVGQPTLFTQDNISDLKFNQIMLNLAVLLPKWQRGYYRIIELDLKEKKAKISE